MLSKRVQEESHVFLESIDSNFAYDNFAYDARAVCVLIHADCP
jgi:hypothetical protein